MDALRLLLSCPSAAPGATRSSIEDWLANASRDPVKTQPFAPREAIRSEQPPSPSAEVLRDIRATKDADAQRKPDRPLLPDGESYERNAQKAEAWGRNAPEGFVLFYLNVRNKGALDYKQQGGQFQDAGNFNFGYVAAAMGLPLEVALRGAGWAQQRAGTSKPEYGNFLGGPPYGDDPSDQEQIRHGFDAYQRDHPGENIDEGSNSGRSWHSPADLP